MTNIVEIILERKLLEQERLHREIEALRIAAKLVKEPARSSGADGMPPQKPSLAEFNRNRMEQVLAFMKAHGGEASTQQLVPLCKCSKEAVREWMERRINQLGDDCPWIRGKNNYHFRLRTATPIAYA